jgi:hypothetical protein
MKYYLHDTNSFNDEKITELFINYGYEGLGLFYTVLEKLATQEKPINTTVLKHQLKVGKKLEKCWKFMESLGILSSNNGETFNKQLLNYSEKFKEIREKNKERQNKFRENQQDIKKVTRDKRVSNDANSIVQYSIVYNKGKCFSEDLLFVFFEDGEKQELGKDQKALLQMGKLKPKDIVKGFIN